MQNINLKYLVEIIVSEVLKELNKRGINILSEKNTVDDISNKKVYEVDMSEYKTPILTERMLMMIDSTVSEIIIPSSTIITHGAKDIIKKRNLKINYK
ncbi:MAG: hypothetical protein QHH13_10635 [Melioribacter sp.]|uniref:hypothetical protein n=1 Tax=Rosettibacter primus TaxID=3111523 RepID=UPI00247EE473|nr:hypothetical protein [Melioribacter sp.]